MDFEGSLALVIATNHVAVSLRPVVRITGFRQEAKEVALHKDTVVHETHLLVQTVSEALGGLRGTRKVLLLELAQLPER